MATLDLDARRAEANLTPHEVTLGGNTYRLRNPMPLEYLQLLRQGKLVEAVQLLLIDPSEWEQMRAAIPDEADLTAITKLYEVDEGESSASPSSSANGGRPSKSTSSGSTASTSPQPAGGRKRSGSAGSTT
jgi:hypothetical protein